MSSEARHSDADGDFVVSLHATKASWMADEPIEISADLAYLGPHPLLEVGGSGSGLVGFALSQLEGNLEMQPGWTADCVRYTLAMAAPLHLPFAKSGGFTGEDPDAAFWEAYFRDPQLRLPAGRWEISAVANFNGAGCREPKRNFTTGLVIEVR